MPNLQVSEIYLKTWNAIHAKNPDGTRKYRYIIHKGSSRSSKTYSLIDCYDTYARSEDNKRMTVWRSTKTDCKKTVLNDTIKHLKKTGRYGVAQIFNKTESIFTYATDSTFEIHGTDDVDTVMGLTQDVAWLNEPYSIPKDVFDQIDQRTSDFILIDLNPKMKLWVDDLEKDPRSIVIHSTWRDNPFIPLESKYKILGYQSVKYCDIVVSEVLTEQQAKQYNIAENKLCFSDKQLRELARCKNNEDKNSANDYNWFVFGLGLASEKPNRIFKWRPISPDAYRELDVPIYYGIDWGTEHPWGVIEVKYYDGCLYLNEINYDSENKLRDKLTLTELKQIQDGEDGFLTWYFEKFQIQKPGILICDNNRKNKILTLRKMGYNAMPAYKEAGSLIDGIDEVNTLKVYYTNTSTNIEYEQENYVRKVDRYGIVLEEPVDADNHCFVGNTLITTDKGDREICKINIGDKVLTSNGLKEVLHVWDNGIKDVVTYSMQFDTFVLKLTCTPTHKIKTDIGWIEIQNVTSQNKIYLHSTLMEKNIDFTQVKSTFRAEEKECIQKYGKNKMVQFLKAIMFTTWMKIDPITICQTWNSNMAVYIYLNMVKKGLQKTLNLLNNFTKKELKRLKNGMQAIGEILGIKMHGTTHSEFYLKIGNMNVTIANPNIYQEQHVKTVHGFVPINANQHIEESQELMTLCENVHAVPMSLKSINTVEQKHAHLNAQKVYDLMINETHEYFANGVLVHNCMDPIRYVTTWLIRRGIIKKL